MMPAAPAHPDGWLRAPGVLAWPRGWQRPARTEEWAFECGTAGLGRNPFAQLVCFPWATLVDLLDRGHHDRARPFEQALAMAAPRSSLIRATVCQHIRLAPIVPWLKALQVTDLFWSHARSDQFELDGIRLHPFPLYPVRALEGTGMGATGLLAGESATAPERRYLYSFIGAYAAGGYLTPARQWIIDLPRRDDAFVMLRGEWHYESTVYGEQIGRRATAPEVRARLARDGAEFDAVLRDSIFSLCPSGTGPNSIRFWESLGFGCIPVLLADSLRLPGTAQEWDEGIVRLPETAEAVATLPTVLRTIASDPGRLARMRRAAWQLWTRFGEHGPSSVLGVLADPEWVRARVAPGGAMEGVGVGSTVNRREAVAPHTAT